MTVHQQIFQLLEQPMLILKQRNHELLIEDANVAFMEMTGHSLTHLKSRDGRELAKRFKLDLTKRVLKSEILIRTKARTKLKVRVEQMPLPKDPNDEWTRALLIAEDLTAYNWIEEQHEKGSVLMSGIMDKHMHVRFLRHSTAPRLFEPDVTLEDETLLHFIAESEHGRIKQLLREAAQQQQERSVTLQTGKQSGVQLELELTFFPIRNGFGRCNEMAFVIWDIKPAGEHADDPSVKLKIWMAKREMTAGQLAEATGISLQTISKLRNGKIKKPQRLTAELIASELGIDTRDIWPSLRK
ncbi:XRE family transcriptional regulator [Paenibacillus nanensis]|uniref:XRE family transcriptional regulator n=1 Tax=Paenibacillus nanensis TaxID=393251 RepID=A0A3A1V073_9BACL|nr:helix-turn-helix transcriptional regulator [Paenibacillus nanensis]RIX54148.1 XRE family transcriptional regulator [Paenibacillus nanensis]